MGFDVTFHPVGAAELQRFVFDVADEPELGRARLAEITTQGRRQDLWDGVLSRLPGFVDEVRRGTAAFANTIAFASAAVAGYLHPFWYARGSALSFFAAAQPKITRLLRPLPTLARGAVATLRDASHGLLTGNYSASGFVAPEDLPRLLELFEAALGKPAGSPVFDAQGADSLRRAIAYARARGLGLIEASDLVVPISGESYTDSDNLRAHFLNNEAHAEPGKAPSKPRARPGAAKKAGGAKKAAKKQAPAKRTEGQGTTSTKKASATSAAKKTSRTSSAKGTTGKRTATKKASAKRARRT